MKKRNIFVVFLIILTIFCSSCDGPPYRLKEDERARMVRYYEDDVNYVNIVLKLKKYEHFSEQYVASKPRIERMEDVCLWFEFDEEGNEQLQLYDNNFYERELETFFLGIIVVENLLIAEENGFDLESAKNEYIMTVSIKEWWPGWLFPVAAIKSKDGSITYLDYEQGKANVINFVQNVIYR